MMRVQLWLLPPGHGFRSFVWWRALTILTDVAVDLINHYNGLPAQALSRTGTISLPLLHPPGVGRPDTNLRHGTKLAQNTVVASGAFIAFGVWVWFSDQPGGVRFRQAGTRKKLGLDAGRAWLSRSARS